MYSALIGSVGIILVRSKQLNRNCVEPTSPFCEVGFVIASHRNSCLYIDYYGEREVKIILLKSPHRGEANMVIEAGGFWFWWWKKFGWWLVPFTIIAIAIIIIALAL